MLEAFQRWWDGEVARRFTQRWPNTKYAERIVTFPRTLHEAMGATRALPLESRCSLVRDMLTTINEQLGTPGRIPEGFTVEFLLAYDGRSVQCVITRRQPD